MNVQELITKLEAFPPNAEVLVRDDGDPSVGIHEATWGLSGKLVDDSHLFIAASETLDGLGCYMCGVIKEAHAESPVVVLMQVES